jgi:ATP-grasp domain, R2K clade family 3
MIILFCDNGHTRPEVDYLYAEEFAAAKQLNAQVGLISFEELTKRKNLAQALHRIKSFEGEVQGIYRGWMLQLNDYQLLYEGLLAKNIRLVNTPDEYAFCHYLPNNYETIRDKTPKSVWMDLSDGYTDESILELVGGFGNHPIIVKDYVKSQKHYWEDACFIPNPIDHAHLLQVTKRFLELQDIDLNIGLVYRAFIEFEPLVNHSISGMPLTKEFRVFVKDKRIINTLKYWDEGEYNDELPDLAQFQPEIERINSHFYTMDIAQTKTGDWLIVELGDGQTAGLPEHANRLSFLQALQ